MLSRVASHIYWLGRYLERAEGMARTLTVHDRMLMDLSEFDRSSTWYQLIAVNSNESTFSEAFSEPTEQNMLQFPLRQPVAVKQTWSRLSRSSTQKSMQAHQSSIDIRCNMPNRVVWTGHGQWI